MPAVGVIVNPWAGKDLRRFHGATGHTPDSVKISVVRRVVCAALDAGAPMVMVAADASRIAARAIRGLSNAELIDGPGTGSALDSRRAGAQLFELGCCPIVVLGGDGTCRDVATGAPDAALIAISTGTNNVFPRPIDGSSAGTAAGLLSCGLVALNAVSSRAKRLVVTIGDSASIDIALVDVAAIAATDSGARAVVRADSILGVVAVIARPASTGLSAIVGRVCPISQSDDAAAVARLCDVETAPRRLRVPIVPGQVDVVGLASMDRLALGESIEFVGPLTLAYDGERERTVPAGATVRIVIDRLGPIVVDVDQTLLLASAARLFDVSSPVAASVPYPAEACNGN